MKAVIWTKYGAPGVLEVRELPEPAPKSNEVLINVRATTVTAGDCEVRSFTFPALFWLPMRLFLGLVRPRIKILGQELAGEVVAVGEKVTEFKPGDRVLAATMMRFGAYAEFVCLPESYPVVKIPNTLPFEEAATIPTGGLNGLHFIQHPEVAAGDQVLINGAGGSIGTYALQIAKHLGATVTCVDSGPKLDMLRELGADHVIDYTREDFTQQGQSYDVIVDVVGKAGFADCIRLLNAGGRLVLGNPTFTGMIRGLWVSKTSNKKVRFKLAGYEKSKLRALAQQVANGTLKAVIDRTFTLEDMQAAHTYVESSSKKGNLVITTAPVSQG